MNKKPILASVLSLLVPGLGQLYAGKSTRGAAILILVIIVGNLNAIWLSIYSLTSPGASPFWTYTLPLLLHKIFAYYGIGFLIWQIFDAYQVAKVKSI